MASKRNSPVPQRVLRTISSQPAGRPPTVAPPRQWWLFPVALAISLVVFGPALNGSLIFDDLHLPFASPFAEKQPAAFWIGGVRPILGATYWANFLLSGTKTFSYHLVNLCFHAGTAVIVFLILERLLALAGVTGHRRYLAFAGAALFLVHPLQTESVDYIAGRSELVSGFFFSAGWLVFLNHFESETSFLTSMKILLLAGVAVLSKESAIAFPLVLLATDLFWSKHGLATQLRRRLSLYLCIVFGAVVAVIVIVRSLITTGEAGFAITTALRYALTECRVMLIYMGLFLVPVNQNGDWQLPLFRSATDGGALYYPLAIITILVAIVFLYRRTRLASFGLAIFLLMLSPTSSFVAIRDVLAERRMYLPIIGLILAVVAIPVGSRVRSRTLLFSALPILVCASLLSWQRSTVWASDLAFWRDSSLKNPTNPRAHLGLGLALMRGHDYTGAAREFSVARVQDPGNAQIVWDLATAYELGKQSAKALALFRELALTHPSAEGFNQIGYLEGTEGNVGAALSAFESALKIDPNNAAAYAYRGAVRKALDDPTGAEGDFKRALEIDPNNEVALRSLTPAAAGH